MSSRWWGAAPVVIAIMAGACTENQSGAPTDPAAASGASGGGVAAGGNGGAGGAGSSGTGGSTDHWPAIDATPGIQQVSMMYDGLERRFDVVVPDALDAGTSPTLLLLHGAGQTGTHFRTSRGSLVQRASTEGWVLVLPTATESTDTNKTRWNYNRAADGPDDEGFVLDALNAVTVQLAIEDGPRFVAGFSNGAKFTHQLLGQYPDVFVAGAPIAGDLGTRVAPDSDEGLSLPPTAPAPILMANGSDDPSVPWQGGAVEGGFLPSVQEQIDRWVARNGCSPMPARETLQNGAGWIDRWTTGCESGAVVVHVAYETNAHLWPDPGDVVGWNASDAVLDFFAAQ